MKPFTLLLLGAVLTSSASAALAPQYQNAKDLDVMLAFIKQHPKVMSTLISIDFRQRTVTFGEDCVAKFARAQKPTPPGFVGPAAPLEFSSSNCPTE
jgi:hypothetical protein